MGVDVVNIFRLCAVYVAWQIQIVVIVWSSNLVKRHEPGVSRHIYRPHEGVDNAVNVLFAETVLTAVLDERPAGVDHINALATGGILLVEDKDTCRDTRTVEQVGGQTDDS